MSPYTPPSLETKQRQRRGGGLERQSERAGVLPGNRKKTLFLEMGSLASTDVAPLSGFRGQLFDIVKMEERETWTARFLRTEAGCKSG